MGNPVVASPLVELGIPLLAVLVAAGFLVAVRVALREGRAIALATAGVAAYFAGSGVLAASGMLADVTRRPPAFPLLLLALSATTIMVARSAFGRRLSRALPLWALIGSQAFRLPLELVMHQAAREGVMTVEMSFEGYNFDIVTGTTALVLGVALYFGKVPRALTVLWNVVGATLLAVVVTIALASSPFIHAFGTEPEHVNTWVFHFPYVWLPAILVQAALFGHLAVGQRLAEERRAPEVRAA